MRRKIQKLVSRWVALSLCLCMILPSAAVVSAAEEPAEGTSACTGGGERTL